MKNVDYDYDTTVPLLGETLSTALWIRRYVRQLLILATKVSLRFCPCSELGKAEYRPPCKG